MSDFTVLVVGLPEAGKTTFLAAFWHALNADSGYSLRLHKLHPLRDYLNGIRDAWLKCVLIGRTTLATEHVVRLSVTAIEAPSGVFEVVFPDHAGEKFVQQWSHRQWDAEYTSLVEDADGILLFINPNSHNLAPTIGTALPLATAIDPQLADASTDDAEEKWDSTKAPGDVQLVDLLQSVLWLRNVDKLPVTVAISAWDVVKVTNLTPNEWLGINSPLLAQFLDSTIGADLYSIFGVSSQGGSLSEADRLLEIADPMNRIEVISEHGSSHDITLPVRWLLEQRRET